MNTGGNNNLLNVNVTIFWWFSGYDTHQDSQRSPVDALTFQPTVTFGGQCEIQKCVQKA